MSGQAEPIATVPDRAPDVILLLTPKQLTAALVDWVAKHRRAPDGDYVSEVTPVGGGVRIRMWNRPASTAAAPVGVYEGDGHPLARYPRDPVEPEPEP